jgi:hypothetical protein
MVDETEMYKYRYLGLLKKGREEIEKALGMLVEIILSYDSIL